MSSEVEMDERIRRLAEASDRGRMAVHLGGRDLLEDAERVGPAVPSGGHGRECQGGEEDPGHRGRVPGIFRKLERGAAHPGGERAQGASPGDRRWSTGVLAGVAGGLPDHKRTAMLATQDPERPELPA